MKNFRFSTSSQAFCAENATCYNNIGSFTCICDIGKTMWVQERNETNNIQLAVIPLCCLKRLVPGHKVRRDRDVLFEYHRAVVPFC